MADEIWWQKYRNRRQHRANMDTEMIVRRIFRKIFKEYTNNSCIGGVKQIFESKLSWKQRVVWVFVFIVLCGGIFYSLRCLYFDSITKPLIVTMESSTYSITNIDFPAIALCNVNRISKRTLRYFATVFYPELAKNNETLEEVEWFTLQIGRLIDFTYADKLTDHPFMESVVRAKNRTHSIIGLMKQIAPQCEDMLIKCWWAGQLVNCSSIFDIRRTTHGHCCAFNYVLAYNSAGVPSREKTPIKRQMQAGPNNGLTVILDPQIDDYAYPIYNMFGFEVLIFDPTHFADPSGGRVIQRFAQPNQAVYFELQSIKQIADQEIRKYPYSTRNCLFSDEGNFNHMYSYSACIVHCRIRTVQSICKCTPYFLPVDRSEASVCTLEKLKCLNKYKEKLFYIYPYHTKNKVGLETETQNSLHCPECLPDCELTRHNTKFSKIPFGQLHGNDKNFRNIYIENINMTSKCVLNIYQSTDSGTLDRLDVVYYWYEILSIIGGYSGMLVGLCIISILELIYFFIVRFFIEIYNFYHE